MSNTETPKDGATQMTSMQIGIGPQYIKDFSFEIPNAPQIFTPTQNPPEINMGVNVHTRGVADHAYEVVLVMKLDAKLDGKQAFIAELSYGGVFMIQKMPEEQLRAFLLVEGPRILFPFARQVLMNAIREGGFPQVMITPIDFGALYLANKDKIGAMPAAGAA